MKDGNRSLQAFEVLLRWRWLVLVLTFALIGLTASSLPKLVKDTSADAFIGKDQPALVYKNRIEKTFGLTDPVVVAVIDRDENGIYDPDNLALVQRLTQAIEGLPQIDPERVTSIATENHIAGNAEGIVVEGFLDENTDFFTAPLGSQERAQQIRAALEDFPLYQGLLVSRDGSTTLIVAELLNDDLATKAYHAIEALVAAESLSGGTEVHVAGEGAVMGYLSSYIDRDASRLNPLAALIITVVLFVGFMSIRAAILPNLIVAGTVLGSFGLMAASSTPFYVITNGLVVNLIGIAVADSIHVLSNYYTQLRTAPELTKQQAIVRAMSAMWRPISLTSITTMAGFMALSLSSVMPPVESFGRFGALGVLLAWVYSMTLLPVLLSLWPTRRVPRPFANDEQGHPRIGIPERMMDRLGAAVLAAPRPVVLAGGLLFLVGVGGALQVQVEEERIANFKSTEKIHQADKAINASMDGIYSLDVLIETPEPGGLYDPEVLRRIESLQRHIETLPAVGGTTSIVDYVKQLHRAVSDGNRSAYTIPDDPQLIAQLFFLYGASADPTDFEEEVDYDFQHTLLRAQVSEGRYSINKQLVPVLERYVAEHFNDENATATVTGRVSVSYYWFQGVDKSTLLSIALSFGAVVLAAIILFRSTALGLLAAVPVGLAILLVYAVMGFAGIPLDIGTSMFAAIAIGLSIDFAIHSLDRIQEIARTHGLTARALQALYPDTGRALLFNFIAVAGGFGVLVTSEVPPLIKFGTLVAVAVSTAFLASLTLLPALVLLLKPQALTKTTIEENSHVPTESIA